MTEIMGGFDGTFMLHFPI